MTTEEKRMMQPAQEYIRKLQHKRNAGTEDCMLSSDLGRDMGITALDLHHYRALDLRTEALQGICRAWICKDSKPLPLQLEGRPH